MSTDTPPAPDLVERLRVKVHGGYPDADAIAAAAEIERLQAEINLARSSDIPHLLGMLEAFNRPAPKFIQTNQDRWREALSDD